MAKTNAYGFLIKQIHDELEKRANNSMRAQDITFAQMRTLFELRDSPEKQMPLKQLEKLLHVAQSTAAGIVVRLEQKGFIESFGDAKDRRIKIIKLTSAGEQCCRQAENHIAETEAALLSELTETERIIFLNLLEKVFASIK